jgi:hypothetical protein
MIDGREIKIFYLFMRHNNKIYLAEAVLRAAYLFSARITREFGIYHVAR